MTRHWDYERDDGVMIHLCDSEAWKHFDRVHPDFSKEPRNVRLGLCTDGFNPFGQVGKTYSCWPVVLTPYNLPPDLCMRREFMFLTVLIPGDRYPGAKIDVYLQPLIDELKSLWDVGLTDTYDVASKTHFNMRAALLWTVSCLWHAIRMEYTRETILPYL